MKIPYAWIREFVDLRLTAAQAADRLVNAGIEVASVTPLAPDCKGVVVGEIEAIAASLGFPGIWFLNGCYEWGCTSVAREQDGAPWLARTLDWPFPGLGRHLEIARMQDAAGRFDIATWPGYVGTLTGSAPGRDGVGGASDACRRRPRARAR